MYDKCGPAGSPGGTSSATLYPECRALQLVVTNSGRMVMILTGAQLGRWTMYHLEGERKGQETAAAGYYQHMAHVDTMHRFRRTSYQGFPNSSPKMGGRCWIPHDQDQTFRHDQDFANVSQKIGGWESKTGSDIINLGGTC